MNDTGKVRPGIAIGLFLAALVLIAVTYWIGMDGYRSIEIITQP